MSGCLKWSVIVTSENNVVASVQERSAENRNSADRASQPRRQPKYHVILWNDDDYSFWYVIAIMKALFHHAAEKGYEIAKQVHTAGKAIVLTTTGEHAELTRDQIHAYGKDALVARCAGSMSSSIEPESWRISLLCQ